MIHGMVIHGDSCDVVLRGFLACQVDLGRRIFNISPCIHHCCFRWLSHLTPFFPIIHVCSMSNSHFSPGQTVKATETVETVTKRSVGGLRIPCPILGVVNPSPSTLNMIFSGYFPILQRQFPAPEREQFDPKVGTFVGWFASNWKLPWQRNTEVPTKPTNPLSHYILTLLPIFLQISQVRIPKLSELPYDKMLFPRTWEKHQVNISERHFPQQLGWIKSLIPQKTDYRFEKYLERSWPAAGRRTCDSISSSVF